MKMYRASGYPVHNKHKDAYLLELNNQMDKLESTIGKCTQDNADVFQSEMEKIHRSLSTKYPAMIEVPAPTPAKIMKMCKEFGSVAYCIENGELVAYVLDL